jgi:hypothetical protein
MVIAFSRITGLLACAILLGCECDKGMLSSDEVYGDLEVSVRTEWKSGRRDVLYGLIIRHQHTAGGGSYEFAITGDGQYLVRRENTAPSIDSLYTTLVDLTPSEAIKRRGKNRLGVRAIGAHFEFSVNEVLVAELTDSTFASGEVGVFLDPRNNIEFCEMRITALD